LFRKEADKCKSDHEHLKEITRKMIEAMKIGMHDYYEGETNIMIDIANKYL